MLGSFNPILGQIWTNPNVGLKKAINKFNPTAGFVQTTQRFLQCKLVGQNVPTKMVILP